MRHEATEQALEASVVRGFEQVSQLVDQNVFKALRRLFRQIGVQADQSGGRVTASPFRFHALEEIAGDLHAKLCFPFRNQRRHNLMQQSAVPFLDDLLPLRQRAARPNDKRYARLKVLDHAIEQLKNYSQSCSK